MQLDSRAFEPGYLEQIRVGYPFHPELIPLFAERLADIPEFHATRGALRLIARTVRAVWDRGQQFKGTLLLQPHHVDLTRSDLRDEILSRLGRTAFERGLEADAEGAIVLAPEVVRRRPLWLPGERRIATEEVWDRLRKEPELPIVLKATDLFPTLRAGVTTTSEALWVYYNQSEKKIYTRDNAHALSSVLAANHFLYDPTAAIADRIMPVVTISPQEVWDHLWPRQGADRVGSVTTRQLMEAAKASAHFPVMPEGSVLWQALHEGAREHRWVLYLRGPNLAIGGQEIHEWPGTPRFDEAVKVWTYQAALDQGMYPRPTAEVVVEATPFTILTLRSRCWPSRAEELAMEDLERHARGIWRDLTRSHLSVSPTL